MTALIPDQPTPLIIARFSEITLKGRNRAFFEKRMERNAALHLRPHGPWRIRRERARLVVNGGEDVATAVAILRGLPGIANVSVTRPVSREPQQLEAAALDYTASLLAGTPHPEGRTPRFRVTVDRKDKRYPQSSMEVAAQLGHAILEQHPGLKVDLGRPDFTLMVEIWEDGALLFGEKLSGPGGLAVGSSGRAVCLISGGIDSPVAAYLMMTRGCPVVYLNFHSFPFIGEQSKEKVHDLVRLLSRHQPASRIYVAPFANIQQAIRDHCPEGLRTILYRRLMNRVANAVAEKEGALALVTGESMGQVASQTMENIYVIQQSAAYPVMQPLIGMSKEKIIAVAREIGTYPISIQPYPDCCTLFQPRHPETRAKPERVHRAEAALPLEPLVAECVAGLEVTDYGPQYYPTQW
ncbi:MAG: tRNA 4-thiouridine(8) synthase ThiI [SAR324 cluster bacterium]|nr:tRNA 4-thiouridine(8) synthase ThiI [SAR324 cluster bacterium]